MCECCDQYGMETTKGCAWDSEASAYLCKACSDDYAQSEGMEDRNACMACESIRAILDLIDY
jgi:hypothetical protein